MKAFLKKYGIGLNLILALLLSVAALSSWYEFFEEQKGRSIVGGIVFSFFSIMRAVTVYSLWKKQKESLTIDEGLKYQ